MNNLTNKQKTLIFGGVALFFILNISILLVFVVHSNKMSEEVVDPEATATENVTEEEKQTITLVDEPSTEGEPETRPTVYSSEFSFYGTGSFILSDEDFESTLHNLDSANPIAEVSEISTLIQNTRESYKSSEFEDSTEAIYNFVNSHYFSDSPEARELLLMYKDSFFVKNLTAEGVAPSTIVIDIEQIQDPFAYFMVGYSTKTTRSLYKQKCYNIADGEITFNNTGILLAEDSDKYKEISNLFSYPINAAYLFDYSTPTGNYRTYMVSVNYGDLKGVGSPGVNQLYLYDSDKYDATTGEVLADDIPQ